MATLVPDLDCIEIELNRAARFEQNPVERGKQGEDLIIEWAFGPDKNMEDDEMKRLNNF